jgi:hypothetical protein
MHPLEAISGGDFPIYLQESQGHTVALDMRGIIEGLVHDGYSATLEVQAFFDDALDNRHLSRITYLDLDNSRVYQIKGDS